MRRKKSHRRGEENRNFRYENYESYRDSGADKHKYGTGSDVFCSPNKRIVLLRNTVSELFNGTVYGLSHQDTADA